MTGAEGALFFMGGIALIVWAVIFLDRWGRRKERAATKAGPAEPPAARS